MGKISRLVSVIVAAFILLAVGYCVMRALSSWHQGYSWSEMDWNQDGTTTIGEFFEASDIGKRGINIDGKKCVEYYAYKDGLPVKTICPDSTKDMPPNKP